MNGARYGKGDRPRNNWGPQWYTGYDTINWHRSHGQPPQSPPSRPPSRAPRLSSRRASVPQPN